MTVNTSFLELSTEADVRGLKIHLLYTHNVLILLLTLTLTFCEIRFVEIGVVSNKMLFITI